MSTLYDRRENYRRVPSSETGNVIVKVGEGYLYRVCVNTAGAGTITLYDNTSAAGNLVIAAADASVVGTLEYGVPLVSGLSLSKTGTSDVTVIYK